MCWRPAAFTLVYPVIAASVVSYANIYSHHPIFRKDKTMCTRKRPAWSRIEIAIIGAILGTLVGLLFSVFPRIRDTSSGVFVRDNLKQVMLATYSCHDTFKRLPPAWGEFPPRTDASEPQQTARAPVHVWLMPFVEGDYVYKAITQPPPKGRNDDKSLRAWRLSSLSDVIPYTCRLGITPHRMERSLWAARSTVSKTLPRTFVSLGPCRGMERNRASSRRRTRLMASHV